MINRIYIEFVELLHYATIDEKMDRLTPYKTPFLSSLWKKLTN